jgi:hypothetical protein
MSSEEAVGYGRPPVSRQFRKGQTGNPGGRTKEYHPPFDPGIILQTIESETISVLANGKRKKMSKVEIDFRQLFNQAAGGDMEAAKSVLNMAKRYFASEVEGDFESQPGPHLMTERQYASWERKRKRRQSPQLVSRTLVFREIAQQQVTIEIDGRKVKRTIFEGVLRRISTMALNKDPAASKLLEVARRQYPGIRTGAAPLIFILSEDDLKC